MSATDISSDKVGSAATQARKRRRRNVAAREKVRTALPRYAHTCSPANRGRGPNGYPTQLRSALWSFIRNP